MLLTKPRGPSFLALGFLSSVVLACPSSESAAPMRGAAARGSLDPIPAAFEESTANHPPDLGLVRPPSLTFEQQRHLARLGVDGWQAAGFRGQGVKVAVLDTGFRGYRNFLGNALPANVTVKSFRPDGNLEAHDSQHGILCAEVIHTLAPDAELLFANWDLDSPASFLDAVRWARREGARVVTCSVITPEWSDGEGGGAIHQALTGILDSGGRPGGLLCFAAAGNTARRHWFGRFQPGPDGFHQWARGQENNVLTPLGGDPVEVELYTHPDANYELYAYDETKHAVVGHAVTSRDQKDRHYAMVRFLPEWGHTYEVRVRLAGGTSGWFHLVALSTNRLCYATARGSVSFPADGPEVIALGAVDAHDRLWSYSSCGPNSPETKPDFVAPVPFPSGFRRQAFGGTSAASPQAAALAALWWSRHPDWTASQVRAAMRDSAHDLGTRGADTETGYGLIHLPRV